VSELRLYTFAVVEAQHLFDDHEHVIIIGVILKLAGLI